MRTLCAAADEGSEPAALAVAVFCYRAAKAVGALAVALGGLDAVVFTGGIGEHSDVVRRGVLERLGVLGLQRGPRGQRRATAATRRAASTPPRSVAPVGRGPAALVVPTDEELVIARDTAALADRRTAMTRTLLVAPTGHGVGLTAVCLGLLQGLEQQGVEVGFYKPLAQPGTHGSRVDHSTALVRLSTALRPPDPIPAGRVEQALSRNQLDALMEDVVAAAEPLLAEHDVLVVEGLVPGSGLGLRRAHQHRAGQRAGRRRAARRRSAEGSDRRPGRGGRRRRRLAETIGITARTYRAGERDRVVGAVVNRVPDTVARGRGAHPRRAGRPASSRWSARCRCARSCGWPRVSDAVAGLDARCSTPATRTAGSRTSSWPRRPCRASCRCCARAPW